MGQLALLQKKLEESLGKKGLELLYESTKQGFLKTSKELEGFSEVKSEFLAELHNLVKHLGFGNVKIVSVNDRETKAVVRVTDNPYPEECKTRGRVDYMLAGVVAGYFSKYFEKDVSCKEVSCRAEGKQYCEFIVSPSQA